MKRIDRYIIRQFVMYYAATLIGFITMLVVVDISGKVHRITGQGNFIASFINYYLNEIPFILNPLLPIIAVMAAVFAIIGLKRRNELVCMLSSGVSIHRILLPIGLALVLTVPVFIVNTEIIIPYLAREQQKEADTDTLITAITTPSHVAIASVNTIRDQVRAEDFSLTIMARDTGRLVLFLYTPSVTWQADRGAWAFAAGDIMIKTRDLTTIDASRLPELTAGLDPRLFPSPQRLAISSRPPSSLSARELGAIMPSRHAGIELFHRFSFPLVMFLLIFMVIPFSAGQDRNASVFVGVGIALGFIFLVYGVVYSAIFLGGKGFIPAWAAGLAPFIVFTGPAAMMYRRIKT